MEKMRYQFPCFKCSNNFEFGFKCERCSRFWVCGQCYDSTVHSCVETESFPKSCIHFLSDLHMKDCQTKLSGGCEICKKVHIFCSQSCMDTECSNPKFSDVKNNVVLRELESRVEKLNFDLLSSASKLNKTDSMSFLETKRVVKHKKIFNASCRRCSQLITSYRSHVKSCTASKNLDWTITNIKHKLKQQQLKRRLQEVDRLRIKMATMNIRNLPQDDLLQNENSVDLKLDVQQQDMSNSTPDITMKNATEQNAVTLPDLQLPEEQVTANTVLMSKMWQQSLTFHHRTAIVQNLIQALLLTFNSEENCKMLDELIQHARDYESAIYQLADSVDQYYLFSNYVGFEIHLKIRNEIGLKTMCSAGENKRMQQQLMLIMHARECRETVPTCIVPKCEMMKNTLSHMKVCEMVEDCSVMLCASSRKIIGHWEKCDQNDCSLCSPARQLTKIVVPSVVQNANKPVAHTVIFEEVTANAVEKTKEWHGSLSDTVRTFHVHQLAELRLSSRDRKSIGAEKFQSLATFACTFEADTYQNANSRTEYYRIIGEKLHILRLERRRKIQRKQLLKSRAELETDNVKLNVTPILSEPLQTPQEQSVIPQQQQQQHTEMLEIPSNEQEQQAVNQQLQQTANQTKTLSLEPLRLSEIAQLYLGYNKTFSNPQGEGQSSGLFYLETRQIQEEQMQKVLFKQPSVGVGPGNSASFENQALQRLKALVRLQYSDERQQEICEILRTHPELMDAFIKERELQLNGAIASETSAEQLNTC